MRSTDVMAKEEETIMENGNGKGMRSKTSLALVILAIVYAIWPVDLMPGMPIDDFVVGALALVGAYMSNSRIGENR